MTQLPLRSTLFYISYFWVALFLYVLFFFFGSAFFAERRKRLLKRNVFFLALIAGLQTMEQPLGCCSFNEHNGEVFDETIQKYVSKTDRAQQSRAEPGRAGQST